LLILLRAFALEDVVDHAAHGDGAEQNASDLFAELGDGDLVLCPERKLDAP
jgi:hypothetical protein